MNESNAKRAENQAVDPEAIRRRIHLMKLDFPFLDQTYLAKKLNRSSAAITFALSGRRNTLLARVVRHLDYLEARRAKKLAAINQKAA